MKNDENITIPETLTFNGTSIPIPQGYEVFYVPVKPICEIIDTDYLKQNSWLKQDEYFSQLYTTRYTVGADNKRRKMNCLPIIDVLTWVASISNHSKTDLQLAAKYDFMKWLRRQTMKLYKSINQVLQENEHEVHLLKKIEEDEADYQEKMGEAKFYRDRIDHNKKSLEENRINRFKAQYEIKFKPRLGEEE